MSQFKSRTFKNAAYAHIASVGKVLSSPARIEISTIKTTMPKHVTAPICFSLLILVACVLSSCASPPPPRTSLDDEPLTLRNAFFGLDDAMPAEAFFLCRGGAGLDGMPVTFSRRLQEQPAPEAFAVITREGVVKTPLCATTEPAAGPAKNHTVLLIGDLGSVDDPPQEVRIVGDLVFAGDDGATGRGLRVDVTPLEDGPTLVLAIAYAPGEIPSDCPRSSTQIVMVVWAGGVQPREGADQEDHRRAYEVTTTSGTLTPPALGDLNDRDNYVHLCLDTNAVVSTVRARGGVVVDPRGDLNPETEINVVTSFGHAR